MIYFYWWVVRFAVRGLAGLKSCRVVVFLLLLLESLCYNDVEGNGGD